MADLVVENASTIFLLYPVSDRGKSWIEEHIAMNEDTLTFGGAVVVEHRYIEDIINGAKDDGLQVEGH